MSERKLATIEVINELRPIENADKIEVAIVKGWECVVKKGEFNVGDKIIYVEVDAQMPDKPEYEFLRERKFRVRTIKLRGQVSQGLVLPLSALIPAPGMSVIESSFDLGDDVTVMLDITKYLSPSEREEVNQQERKLVKSNRLVKFMMKYSWFRKLVLSKKREKGWPYWIAKTDEERVQNLSWNKFFEFYKDKGVYVTEKIDYQSVTFTGKMVPRYSGLLGKLIPSKKYKFIVCSRNMTTNDKGTLYWKIADKYNIEKILRENPNLTIQGEQGDTKVQGNKYGIKEPTMWVFNIIDHEKNYHYCWEEMVVFCQGYGLQTVPILNNTIKSDIKDGIIPTLKDLGSTVQELVEFSKGKSVINPKVEREGVVVRCIENGKKIFSFKIINPNFLLKYSDE